MRTPTSAPRPAVQDFDNGMAAVVIPQTVRSLIYEAASVLQHVADNRSGAGSSAPTSAAALASSGVSVGVLLPAMAAAFARVPVQTRGGSAAVVPAAGAHDAMMSGGTRDGGAVEGAGTAAIARLQSAWGEMFYSAPEPPTLSSTAATGRSGLHGHALVARLTNAVRGQAVLSARAYATPDDIFAIMYACSDLS